MFFYCNECAEFYGLPETLFQTRAKCDGCGWEKTCNQATEEEVPDVKFFRKPPWHVDNNPQQKVSAKGIR